MLNATSAFLNASPNVSPSAHLCTQTAPAKLRHLNQSFSIPIANPSNMACIPIAIYNMKGVKLIFF
jgi:hypothetical protein